MSKRMTWFNNNLTNAEAAGFVERATASELAGWAVSRSGSPVELAIRVDGTLLAMKATWTERLDVAEEVGTDDANVGFIIQTSGLVKEQISRAIQQGKPFEVLANGVVLPLANGVVPVLDAPAGPKPEPDAPRTDINLAVETFDHFVITGRFVSPDGCEAALKLLCNGTPVDASFIRKELKDAKGGEGAFEVAVPGYVWEEVPENGACQLDIRLQDVDLTPGPIEVTRKTAAAWIGGIARMQDGPEKQYRVLLALEHARYGKLLPLLDKESGLFVRNFARQMQLEKFVFGEADHEHPEDVPTEDSNTLVLWKALRLLNARLISSSADVFTQVKAVHDELRLSGEAKQRYFMSVIPLLCRHGEFLHLRQLVDFNGFSCLDQSKNAWEMSLALAPITANGHIAQAADLLYRMPKQLKSGWLNTECIRFAVGHVQKLEADGEIDFPLAEKFRYAFIGLLDAFGGEWFSRLHDQELIDAMVSLLVDLERCTDYHKRDIVAAAIRNYGLCPAFWQRLEIRLSTLPDKELARAKAAWDALHVAVESRETPIAGRLRELIEPIRYFRRRGNHEALTVLREVVANSLPDLNRELSPAGAALIETLLTSDKAEALRVAAFPFAGENSLQARFPETSDNLLNTLRHLTMGDKSVLYELQHVAAATLRKAHAAAAARDLAALNAALTQLENKAIALNNWQGGFLGADLLTSAYLLAKETGLEADPFLMRLGDIIRKATHEAKQDWYLPAAACTALARLAGKPGDAVLRGFLKEVQTVIRDKFGPRHDDLFAKPSTAPARPMAAQGRPQDTLVVIYSCRPYLETRVKAIRETWVQDLKARGIPYVVLVGDGNDTLEGDVLALNVSDKYEDLPKKTLKLFDWVYRNTDAQYVLKIDDDCYLDVERYFDTLSYRKHFYYGRVIRRIVGNTDRAWHHAKSHTIHGQKAIDKSPEPSIYADGGGGYCLSRLAIAEVLKTTQTDAGRRLIACSFMEDKLVGDLLAFSHIWPSNEDYESYQRRRTFGAAMPVGMWENTFSPSRLTPTKIVHLDTERHQAAAREKAATDALWPKKLWPSCWKPSILLNSAQLELLTQADHAAELLRNDPLVVSVVRNEIVMLPHFLAHYRKLGVGCFVIVDNCSDDGTREYLFEQPDVVLYSADAEYRYSQFGVAWQQAVLGNLCLGKWVLVADADELLVYPDSEKLSLPEFIAGVEAEGADAVRVDMVDMYPQGDLEMADFEKQSPFEAAPWFDRPAMMPWRLGTGWFSSVHGYVSHLRHRTVPNSVPYDFVSQKYALLRYRPWVRFSQGLHYAANLNVSERASWFAHFKYHAGLKKKVLVEIRRGQHFNNAAEYRRYAAMLAEGQGNFWLDGVSQRYEGSSSFTDNTEKRK
jgi:hypothetical protein